MNKGKPVVWYCPKCGQVCRSVADVERHRNPWLKLCRPATRRAFLPVQQPSIEHGRGIVERLPQRL
jgi:hypothetical protein